MRSLGLPGGRMRLRPRGGNRHNGAMTGRVLAALCALAVTLSGCGSPAPVQRPAAGNGRPEGEVDLVAWPGTVEDGSNDPRMDWVRPFERNTGCVVTVRYVNTADEMVGLLRQRGAFDGGLVSS